MLKNVLEFTLTAALQGMSQAEARIDRSATDLSAEMVNLLQFRTDFEGSRCCRQHKQATAPPAYLSH